MKKLMLLVLVAGLVFSCSSQREVTRLDPESTTDLSGKWNETDARLVAEAMIQDCLSRPWLTSFVADNGRKPVVTVGRIRNRTSEHIDMETFTADFTRELINSGSIRFVANKFEREDVRDERWDQDEFASAETRKKLREELGADYLLMGSVKSITDQLEGKKTVFYQTDLQLINVESNEIVWTQQKEIKKGISQGRTRW